MTDNPQAFPGKMSQSSFGEHNGYADGMTLRDWFAGQALAGIVAGYWGNPDMGGLSLKDLAIDAYDQADAMLEARK